MENARVSTIFGIVFELLKNGQVPAAHRNSRYNLLKYINFLFNTLCSLSRTDKVEAVKLYDIDPNSDLLT